MNKILTITVPAFNVEQYLRKNIESMADERILEDIEIIVVDDGATDKTPEIADQMMRKYPSSVKVIHKENGGYGSGVNTGIRNATGKYFCVLDADDYVNTDSFVEHVNLLKKVDADLILNDYSAVDPEGNLIKECCQSKKIPQKSVFELYEYYTEMNPFDYPGIGVHTECMKTEILKNKEITCHENHFYTDIEYSMYSLIHLNTVYYTGLNSRFYLIGRPGQSVDRKRQIRLYNQAIDVTKFLCEFYKSNSKKFRKSTEWIYLKLLTHHDRMCYSMQMSNDDKKDAKKKIIEHDKWLKDFCVEAYKANPYIPVKILRKTKFTTFSLAAFIYKNTIMKKQTYL